MGSSQKKGISACFQPQVSGGSDDCDGKGLPRAHLGLECRVQLANSHGNINKIPDGSCGGPEMKPRVGSRFWLF